MGSWSVILNVILLVGVMIAIVRTMKLRRDNVRSNYVSPAIGAGGHSMDQMPCDDIIAVRKVNRSLSTEAPTISPKIEENESTPVSSTYSRSASKPREPQEANPYKASPSVALSSSPPPMEVSRSSLMMFLLAKEDRQLAGYELLQTLLAAGLRFGEGHLFHRHQHSNGQGPVLCSVAAATSSGMFDLQNIGAFSVRGLCIFMETSGNASIDRERFSIMLDTARQLSEDLDTYLLDDQRQPLTDVTLRRYDALLNCHAAADVAFA